ncbi:hypothetical protein [Lysobacter auxotrophicus]|uniref:Uncharacterized protein n=1 Tax=Lysobacter auxotrophicus TaxID=2992573 RepID=A0ABM8DIJ2_9GAMM|nr:hypothetical protein [Lysobacter auxotrophicus]BDU18463.1 hypothetical protein LA521A_36640 [Lysobacter auxotrophicus]
MQVFKCLIARRKVRDMRKRLVTGETIRASGARDALVARVRPEAAPGELASWACGRKSRVRFAYPGYKSGERRKEKSKR